MKLPFLALILIPFFLCSCGDDKEKHQSSNNTLTTPDLVASAVFDAFVANDLSSFKEAMLFSPDQMQAMMKSFHEQGMVDIKDKAKLKEAKDKMNDEINHVTDYHSAYLEARCGDFKKVRRAAEKDGVLWNAAKFVSAEYTVKERRGIKQLSSLHIIFEVGGTKFKIRLGGFALVDGKWGNFQKDLDWLGKIETTK